MTGRVDALSVTRRDARSRRCFSTRMRSTWTTTTTAAAAAVAMAQVRDRPRSFILRDPHPDQRLFATRTPAPTRAGGMDPPRELPFHRAIPSVRVDDDPSSSVPRRRRPDRRSTRSTRPISPAPRRFWPSRPTRSARSLTDPPVPALHRPLAGQSCRERAQRRAPRATHAPCDVHATFRRASIVVIRETRPATARAAAGASASAPPRNSRPSLGRSTTERPVESAATFHNDLSPASPPRAPPPPGERGGGGGQGGQGASTRRETPRATDAQRNHRAERRDGKAGIRVPPPRGPGRPAAPGGRPTSTARADGATGVRAGATASRRRAPSSTHTAPALAVICFERRENWHAGSYLGPRSASRTAVSGEYAEPRGAPGRVHDWFPLAPRGADAGDFDRVHAFDGDIETLELDAEMTGESATRARARAMASHGPEVVRSKRRRHPRHVGRSRTARTAEAEKIEEGEARAAAGNPRAWT